ncbi:V-type ATP synthase subunit B [Tannockella kyphosi]|uniref:V-type ATP synthase subunit B n=1 Tax=Tannockella kyphosi TaxID=2899121 RepID=UPI002010CD09|nr:V-type ATP synthase subunit B [Tannockella kyphosi]
MSLQHIGLSEINGPLVVLDHVQGASFDEMVEITLDDGSMRLGRIVQIEGEKVIIQVFEGTNDVSLTNTKTRLLGKPMELPVSKELLGRTFNGAGTPIDGLGKIYSSKQMDINGLPLNPVARVYPRNYINTGISSIDCLTTLIRGQKLPIFTGSGLPHNQLAVQIVKQAKVADDDGKGFAVVFGAMGVTNDVANYFKRSFKEAGVMDRVVMFVNLANDPIIERILTPRCALTAAEYLAYEENMHVLVIYSDVTSYCEAVREFSSSKGEIPGRKGYPGYLYSDLASLYERAGIIKDASGSVTQIPILTMPNNDITHPVPDLTGYITEGQITLDLALHSAGIYPPVAILPSLSRLMKDGIGQGYTRKEHQDLANQLFASYAHVQDVKSLTSVIGEDELSPVDRQYIGFGKLFEEHFLNQGDDSNRSIIETLDLGWSLLSTLPRSALERLDNDLLDQYYDHEKALKLFHIKEEKIIKELEKSGD